MVITLRPMSCTAPTEVSRIFCRTARCARWSARAALAVSVIAAIVLYRSATGYAQGLGADTNTAQKVVGQLTAFVALFTLQLSFFLLALRRFSVSRHAAVKANQLKAVELLLSKTTEESVRKELLLRSADIVTGKPGCCK